MPSLAWNLMGISPENRTAALRGEVVVCKACRREIDFRELKDCHPIRPDCAFQERGRANQ